MKYIIFLLTIVLFGCTKYDQPKTLQITGEYVVDRITVSTNGNLSSDYKYVYNPGDIMIDPNGTFPLDSISVGFTKWMITYYDIGFNPLQTPTGKVIWQNRYYYRVFNQTLYDLGYMDITMDNGLRRVFHILEDGFESLTLRTTGQWPNGQYGEQISMTIYLTRVGP